MKYFNVSLLGLRGKQHPALNGPISVKQVLNMRIHLKILCGDYLTYEKRARQSGGSPDCQMCYRDCENYCHLATSCEPLRETRERLMAHIYSFCHENYINLTHIVSDKEQLTQFLIDPASMNLKHRVNISDPVLPNLFQLCRRFWNGIHHERTKIIKTSSAQLKANND